MCVYMCVQVCTGVCGVNVQRPGALSGLLCHGSNYSSEMGPPTEPVSISKSSVQGLQECAIISSFLYGCLKSSTRAWTARALHA